MLGNKICVTQKGLDYLSDAVAEFKSQQKPRHSGRTSSLPIIKSTQTAQRQTITQRHNHNQKLFNLTRKLDAIEKVGLKRMKLQSQDQLLAKLLKREMVGKQQYLSTLIPEIVKMTRDPNKTNNIDSRFNRSRAYTDRLVQNYKSQKHFGFNNHLNKGKKQNNQHQHDQNVKGQ